jgi:hypothetical protein
MHPEITLEGSTNIMSLILKSMIEEHHDAARLPSKLDIGLDIEGQKLRLRHSDGKVRITPRTLAGAKAVFSGSLDHFLEVLLSGSIVRSYLAGKLGFRGSPVETLKAYLWLRRVCSALKRPM